MAAVGSAVGLGNFWRFPYQAGENGGAAFVVVYLVAVAAIAYPVLMTEYAIGRHKGLSAVGATRELGRESGAGGIWGIVGWIGMLTGFLILSFYSVIAGWVMAYVPIFASGDLANTTFEEAQTIFGALIGDPTRVLIWHTLFMAITSLIVARGLKGGIEVAANILMPAFFIMLLGMVVYAVSVGNPQATVDYLFTFDFAKITPKVVVEAIGQAFFSVGVASAIMITYGAYLQKDVRIPNASRTVAGADTFVALLAGFAIFPLVFAIPELQPNVGPGLLFQTMPAAIGALPFGSVVGTVFFVLAFFAALTSSISLFEVAVSWIEEHRGISRARGAIIAGILCWIVGVGSVLSTNVLSDFHPLDFGPFVGQTIFDILDTLTSNILLPFSGLLVAIFAGWVASQQVMREELGLSSGTFAVWQTFMRFIIPLAIIGVLVAANFPSLVTPQQ